MLLLVSRAKISAFNNVVWWEAWLDMGRCMLRLRGRGLRLFMPNLGDFLRSSNFKVGLGNWRKLMLYWLGLFFVI